MPLSLSIRPRFCGQEISGSVGPPKGWAFTPVWLNNHGSTWGGVCHATACEKSGDTMLNAIPNSRCMRVNDHNGVYPAAF